MFKRISNRSIKTTTESKSLYPYSTSYTSETLLRPLHRKNILRSIKRQLSVSESIWSSHYMYAIKTFAEYTQNLPASEVHHHSESGGLLDHTLEALNSGVKISLGQILPPNAEPETILSSAEKWRYAVFIAVLVHDMGKIVTDIEVVFIDSNNEPAIWLPWYGKLPPGTKYKYRFRNKNIQHR